MNETILIVDQDRETLELAKTILTSEGYTVRVADHAQEALALIETFKPQVILTDAMLPGEIDGLELARRLPANPATCDAAIAISASDLPTNVRAKAIAAGCDELISRTITAGALCELIATLMKKSVAGSLSWTTRYFEPPRRNFSERFMPTYRALTRPPAGSSASPTAFASQHQPSTPAGIPTYKSLTERPVGYSPSQARRPVVSAGVPTYKTFTVEPTHEMRLAG